jgi:hypothetical protein
MIVKTTMITDGPIALDMELMVDQLIQSARDEAPVGLHTHDQGVPFYNFTPRSGGTLRAMLGSKSNWTYKINGFKMFALVKLRHWGASMLEFGANVAAATKFSMWNQPGVGIKRMWFRKGFTVQPRPFSGKILDRFMQRTHKTGAVKVTWKRGSRKVVS